MTFFGLARKNAWRKPFRTTLTILSVTVAFLVYGLLTSFATGVDEQTDGGGRLVVANRSSSAEPLPLAYVARIAGVTGVAAVSHTTRLRAFVGSERNMIGASAVDPERAAAVFGAELGLTPELVAALNASRDAVLVGRALADAQGWAVGQTVTITSLLHAAKSGSRDWSFRIAGIFEGASSGVDTYFLMLRHDYFNAARSTGADTVSSISVLPAPGIDPASLTPRIDALFANSAVQTRTQPERQFLQAFMRQLADVHGIITLVVGAAFVTILMIVTNTMAFAIRERTFEIGVLKTIGLSGRRIMTLVLSETLFVFAVGGAAGVALAWGVTVIADPAIGLVFAPEVLAEAALLVVALGLASGLLPALIAMRLPIVQTFHAR